MTTAGSSPIVILSKGTASSRGTEVQNNNISAAMAVAEAVRTTLGPRGMDKMLVDTIGDVVITNDGSTILKEIDIEHPAAKMVVEISKTQDTEAGDGTTTAVVIAGELLKGAKELIELDVHPAAIISGYRSALKLAKEALDEIAIDMDAIENDETLLKIARTSLTGKGVDVAHDHLAEVVVAAARAVADEEGVDIDRINVERKVGGRVNDTFMINGVAIDKEKVHSGMPDRIRDAKIALINSSLEIRKTEFSSEIAIKSPDQLQTFLEREEALMKEMVEKIKASGANVVFCQKGMDDLVQFYFADKGILALRRVKKSDMERISRATGAQVITNIDMIDEEALGRAELVEERRFGGDKMTIIEGCLDPKAVSIVLRGGTDYVVSELERAIHDALNTVGSAIEDRKIVAGGGSPEVELAMRLRSYSSRLKGKEQLALKKFADALEVIPETLAENSGFDPMNKLVELRAMHNKGQKTAGIDVQTGKISDMLEQGVIEPLRVKRQALNSAVDAATMLLRIDDAIPMKGSSPGERK
ncbi:MAG: thermosome subunit [Candidatus Syntrophoarchaeum caldarius]|uniref:Thermosome subunit n=1 Tax=Candidatus Syntropharchaeum caldarium TaxID=1838285 RepID=A0A1F2PB95_9EURY|nr:MAG: thermosome subunit [Candidatus Syntrophoarchaeum caldarius]